MPRNIPRVTRFLIKGLVKFKKLSFKIIVFGLIYSSRASFLSIILRQKSTNLKCNNKNVRENRSYEKLTPSVNFTNILCAAFSYKSFK